MSETDPTLLARNLNDLRVRVLAGEQVTPEEYKEVIASIRQARVSAAQSAASKPRKTAVTKVDPDSFI